MRRLLSFALALGLVAGGAGVALTSAHADEPVVPIVSWPTVTKFNPDLYDYEIQIADAGGAGELVAWWGDGWQEKAVLPHVGSFVLDFGNIGPTVAVVARCEAGYQSLVDCTEVSRSPQLTARTELGELSIGISPLVGFAPKEIKIDTVEDVQVDAYHWQLFDRSTPDQVLATGTVEGPFRSDSMDRDVFDFQMPAGLAAGDYRLQVDVTQTTSEYGVLTGSGSSDFVFDTRVPVLKVRQDLDSLYPYRDGYRDSVVFRLDVEQTVDVELEIADSAGNVVVYERDTAFDIQPSSYRWYGTDSNGYQVAPGTYSVTYRADGGANTGIWQGQIVVSGKKLVSKTSSFTIGAAASLTGKPYVGNCSKLAHRGKGGLGFYSQTKCKGSIKRSMVSAYHGVYLPKAFEGRYSSVRVTLNGGPATKSRNNYINIGYLDPKTKKLVKVKSVRGKGGLQAKTASPYQIFDRTKDRPYLIWWSGLTAGSRFNVTSYKVTTTYRVLR